MLMNWERLQRELDIIKKHSNRFLLSIYDFLVIDQQIDPEFELRKNLYEIIKL